jgi:hypothetical protein
MKFAFIIFFLNASLSVSICLADTNILIIPKGDERVAAVFFIDECLTRGISNSISIKNLRKWATSTIHLYQQRESLLATNNAAEKRYSSVLPAEIPKTITTIQNRTPACRTYKPLEDERLKEAVELFSKVWSVSKGEAADRLSTVSPDPDPPSVEFYRSPRGAIKAVTIDWYDYGIIVGPPDFKWNSNRENAGLFYEKKLEEGIFLWHGYK